jgi:putative hydroxymethylpyrimidine transport system permease protein
MRFVRATVTLAAILVAWHAVVLVSGLPHFILPSPLRVGAMLADRASLIATHAAYTLAEILLGLALGTLLGCTTALTLAAFRPARRWLLPLLVVSQAVPVFALAPILVLWFGYGMASKIVMATLVIYFPVTSAFYDGLRRTDPGWLDLARTMDGPRWRVLRHVRLPAALPAFASGLRVAAAVAPIGAVVGEWVGSSVGLGFLMLHANARMQTDLMFAALAVLAAMAVTLYVAVDFVLRRLLPWQPETLLTDEGE